jgi:organic radical activating enzyme
MTHTAKIAEIFESIQGEGLYTGERMTFLRLAGCDLACSYCDTPLGSCERDTCRVETVPSSGEFFQEKNPVSAARLTDLMANFPCNTLSVTGGEPLLQSDFLALWLPTFSHSKRVLLETNGVYHESMAKLAGLVHIVSMDIKLPSSAGTRPVWDEHRAFLAAAIAGGSEVYAKLVVTAKTSDRDIEKAIAVLTSANRYVPTFIQPASPTLKFSDIIEKEHLDSVVRLCGAYLKDVRVAPQMHKQWGIL